ncbi:hypothetical protein CAPTEDRAFT_199139 [Capitella teleta]|uniref:SUEL-type lectin domain-containing protein n=1 Tax=Capitella teleta TaxID=283909 RepID=R7TIC4_CAPTE|nr:hypothetical protein CAPTEDRAFT_199139 [Capitella teleta]|eukprot:ELT93232.1 hypothetical protein CAPTEDRAFT_199139 [Capitella teleta]
MMQLRAMQPRVVLSYCESETFVAKCEDNQIVAMDTASYGRMEKGRCVESSLGYLGCKADVLHLTDRKCSGRDECRIRVPDGQLDSTKPCFKELKVYLEASYQCLKVEDAKALCNSPGSYKISSKPVAISTQMLLKEKSCQRHHHDNENRIYEWALKAEKGQTLNVSLTDFAWRPETKELVNYGYLLDKATKMNITLTGNHLRQKHILVSNGSTVHVTLNVSKHSNFLVHIEALGCADLRPPKHAWLKRPHANEAIIGCNDTRQTWHLRCKGRSWVGVIGNCTQREFAFERLYFFPGIDPCLMILKDLVAARKQAMLNQKSAPLSHDMTIIIIVGISLLICTLIVITGLACIRRVAKKPCCQGNQQVKYDNVRTDDSIYREQGSDASYLSPKYASQGRPLPRQHRNEYSHIWEHPLPDPACPAAVHDGTPQQLKVKLPVKESRVQNNNSTDTGSTGYHVSMASKSSDADSKYFVLDRDAATFDADEFRA